MIQYRGLGSSWRFLFANKQRSYCESSQLPRQLLWQTQCGRFLVKLCHLIPLSAENAEAPKSAGKSARPAQRFTTASITKITARASENNRPTATDKSRKMSAQPMAASAPVAENLILSFCVLTISKVEATNIDASCLDEPRRAVTLSIIGLSKTIIQKALECFASIAIVRAACMDIAPTRNKAGAQMVTSHDLLRMAWWSEYKARKVAS